MKKTSLLLILTFVGYLANAQFCASKVNITGTQSVCLNQSFYNYIVELDRNATTYPQDPVTGKAGFQYKISVTGGQIIQVAGKDVNPTSFAVYDYTNGPAVQTNLIGVKIRWGKYDSNGNLISDPYQQPTQGTIYVEANQVGRPCPFYSCFECGNVNSSTFSIAIQNRDVFNPVNNISSSLPIQNLTGTYTIYSSATISKTVVNPRVIYLDCNNYGGTFWVNNLVDATYSWNIDGLSKPIPTSVTPISTNANANVLKFFPYTQSLPPGGLRQNELFAPNFINLKVSRPCIGLNDQTIYVILNPTPNVTLPTFNSNIGTNAQTLVPVCTTNTYQLNLPYISPIASYTINTIPSGWKFTYNGSTVNAGQAIPATGSPLFLQYLPITSTDFFSQAGEFGLTINQGCGATKRILITLKEINRFKVNVTTPFIVGCTNDQINMNAVVTGNNGSFAPISGSNYWTDNSGTNPTVITNNSSTYQVKFTNGAKSFVTYSSLRDSKGCIAAGNRVYYGIGGGQNNSGWISGQLADNNIAITSQIALANGSENLYFTDNTGKVYRYSFNSVSQKWELSTPLASNALASGNNNPIQVDENIASANKTYVYYVNSSQGVSVASSGVVTNIFSGQLKSGSNIIIDKDASSSQKGTIYFVDNSGTIWSYSPITGGNAVSTGITGVTGSIAVSNGRIFYASSGTLFYRNYGATASVAVPNATASLGITNSSSLTFDSFGRLYYVSYNTIAYVLINGSVINPAIDLINTLNTLFGPIKIPNGNGGGFAGPLQVNVNPDLTNPNASSNNIYYTGYDGKIYIFTPNTTPQILPTTPYPIGASNSSSLVFGSKNLFYISSAGYISNLFGKPCVNPFRTEAPMDLEDLLNSKSNIPTSLAFYPNPAETNVTVNFKTNEIGDRYLKLYDLQGNEILNKKLLDNESKNLTDNVAIEGISSGTYIGAIFQNNKLMASQRLVIK